MNLSYSLSFDLNIHLNESKNFIYPLYCHVSSTQVNDQNMIWGSKINTNIGDFVQVH